ncbi:hypothetical protein COCNU_contig69507673G000010 [Cocos nucifera]|nr:hypothetical protein [Cocos nucifera]
MRVIAFKLLPMWTRENQTNPVKKPCTRVRAFFDKTSIFLVTKAICGNKDGRPILFLFQALFPTVCGY